ncbi:MAG: IS200/IS605 family transposase [Pyrinomonadaceae bacterium]
MSISSRQRRLKGMANTYTQIYLHVVFSTKNRIDWIAPQIEDRVWAYLGGVARKHKMTAIQVGGIDDHIHALLGAPPILSPSQVAKYLKGDTSLWIHREFQAMNGFAWQDGYGAFSVSRSEIPRVVEYIKDQRKHHEKESFEEEYVRLLKLHGIEYDERYLFG